MNINDDNCLAAYSNYFCKGDIIYINSRNNTYKIIGDPMPYTSPQTGDVWLYKLDRSIKNRHINEMINDRIKDAQDRYNYDREKLINKLHEIIK